MTKEITTPNLVELGYKMQEMIQDGYVIDKNGIQYIGWLYVVNMVMAATEDKPKTAKKAKAEVVSE